MSAEKAISDLPRSAARSQLVLVPVIELAPIAAASLSRSTEGVRS